VSKLHGAYVVLSRFERDIIIIIIIVVFYLDPCQKTAVGHPSSHFETIVLRTSDVVVRSDIERYVNAPVKE
jgi:hypothetical protein